VNSSLLISPPFPWKSPVRRRGVRWYDSPREIIVFPAVNRKRSFSGKASVLTENARQEIFQLLPMQDVAMLSGENSKNVPNAVLRQLSIKLLGRL
jgi:hypothetical protein